MKNNLFYFVQLILTQSLFCKICWISDWWTFVKTTRQRSLFASFVTGLLYSGFSVIWIFSSEASFCQRFTTVQIFFQTFHLCVIIFFKKFKTFIRYIFFLFLNKKIWSKNQQQFSTFFMFLVFNNNFYHVLLIIIHVNICIQSVEKVFVYQFIRKFKFS